MHRLVKLAFLPMIIVLVGAFSNSLLAQVSDKDLDLALAGDLVWKDLTPKKKGEVRRALKLLLFGAKNRPPLDPAKAFAEARKQLRIRIQELSQANDSELKKELLENLSPFLSGDGVDLKKSLSRIKTAFSQPSEIGENVQLYFSLAEAIQLFIILAPHAEESYDTLLTGLKVELIDFAKAPTGEPERNKLGQRFAVLTAVGKSLNDNSIDDLLAEIDDFCRQPNLWIYVSEKFINEFIDSAVPSTPESEPVNECILGVSVCGTAETIAKASIDLCNATDQIALTIKLNGKTTSDNIGYKKPVRIKSIGESHFVASKCITISDKVLFAGNASASACTNTTICSIEKVGSQALSGLIEQIAWKKSRQQKSQAEAVASRKLERKVEARFDEKLNGGRKYYEQRFRSLLSLIGVAKLKLSSTSDEMAIGATVAKPDKLAARKRVPPPPHSTEYDLTIKVHDSLFESLKTKEANPEEIDRLIEELLSNLPGGENRIPQDAPQLFKLIREAILKMEAREEVDNLTTPSFKNLPQLEFKKHEIVEKGETWFILNWQLKK